MSLPARVHFCLMEGEKFVLVAGDSSSNRTGSRSSGSGCQGVRSQWCLWGYQWDLSVKVDSRLDWREEKRDTGGTGDHSEGDIVQAAVVGPAHADQNLRDCSREKSTQEEGRSCPTCNLYNSFSSYCTHLQMMFFAFEYKPVGSALQIFLHRCRWSMRPLWMWQSHKPPASPGKKGLKAHKGKNSMLFHLHLCQSMAPQQQYPGEDVGEPLEHNDRLVPGLAVQDLH